MRKLRIGSGAGFGGDRIEPAIDLINDGDLDYIGFECLAERTIALAVQERAADPDKGYSDLLEARFRQILPARLGKRVKVITNMGAANPQAAARKVAQIAESLQIRGLKIAAVTGDDVLHLLPEMLDLPVLETGKPLRNVRGNILSANAYCGVAGIIEALRRGADIVITGRVSDPALFLAPIMYEFGWNAGDWHRLGQGTILGHLLECAAQVTGGYFADPVFKNVPDLWNVGFPIAEIDEDGGMVITKLPAAGGMVTCATVTEQLLYEILDPAAYLTPDVIADFSRVTVRQAETDRVEVAGGTGTARSGLLKVSVGIDEGFTCEGEISFGGPGALARAQLAADIIRRRIDYLGLATDDLRFDFLGINSLYRDELSRKMSGFSEDIHEVRLRVAARTRTRETAERIGREVEALYLNGPAGGGGVRRYVRGTVGVLSVFIPESRVCPHVEILEVK